MKTMKNLTLMILFAGFVFLSMESASAQLIRKYAYQKVVGPEKTLFNGEDLAGWTTVSGSTEINGWTVEDGILHRETKSGDVVTEETYTNFILDFKWKISHGGNSGLKYRFNNFDGSWLGCEFQLLDDANNAEGTTEKHRTGDLYDMFSADLNKNLLPHEQFNHGRIIVNGNSIQHWLNGKLVLNVCVGSPQWEKAFAQSKFHEHKKFGKTPSGKILLQDHGDEVWFKEIVIREIKNIPVKKRTFLSQFAPKRRR